MATAARFAASLLDPNPMMVRAPEEDRDYFLRRCADHLALAEGHADEGRKALHHRFATLYRERADAIDIVQPD